MSPSSIASPSIRCASERSATCSVALGRPHFSQCPTIFVKIFLSPRFRCLIQAPFLRKILPEASPRCPSAGGEEPLRSPALLGKRNELCALLPRLRHGARGAP